MDREKDGETYRGKEVETQVIRVGKRSVVTDCSEKVGVAAPR